MSATSAGKATFPVMKQGFWRLDVGAICIIQHCISCHNSERYSFGGELTRNTEQSPSSNKNSSTNGTEETLHFQVRYVSTKRCCFCYKFDTELTRAERKADDEQQARKEPVQEAKERERWKRNLSKGEETGPRRRVEGEGEKNGDEGWRVECHGARGICTRGYQG